MYNIIVVDDHKIVVEGYTFIFENNDTINVIGSASNGKEALEVIETSLPDVVLLDINMPKMSGLETAEIIKKRWPHIKIIMLTMYNQVAYVKEAMKLNICGYLLKNCDKKVLLEAIDTVMAGKQYYDKNVQAMMGEGYTVAVGDDVMTVLSERELEIITLLSQGMSSTKMADKLFLSTHTIQTHRKNIFFKLKIHNAGELVKFAIENNLM